MWLDINNHLQKIITRAHELWRGIQSVEIIFVAKLLLVIF